MVALDDDRLVRLGDGLSGEGCSWPWSLLGPCPRGSAGPRLTLGAPRTVALPPYPAGVRIFSGIQPTGTSTLGNNIGAIRQYVDGQERAAASGDEARHASSTCTRSPSPTTRPSCASGSTTPPRDPARRGPGFRAVRGLFRQSDVPEHAELTWLLSSVVPQRPDWPACTSSATSPRSSASSSAPACCSTPVLMAADVLAYRAGEVRSAKDSASTWSSCAMPPATSTAGSRPCGSERAVSRAADRCPSRRTPEVGARTWTCRSRRARMSTSSASPEGTVYLCSTKASRWRRSSSGPSTDSETGARRPSVRPEGEARRLEPARDPRGLPPHLDRRVPSARCPNAAATAT